MDKIEIGKYDHMRFGKTNSLFDECVTHLIENLNSKKEKVIRTALLSIGVELSIEVASNYIQCNIDTDGNEHYYYMNGGNTTWLCTFYNTQPPHVNYTQTDMAFKAHIEVKYSSLNKQQQF